MKRLLKPFKRLGNKENFVPVNELVKELKSRSIETWFDRLTFSRIFLAWASIVVLFGLVYYFFGGSHSFLYYTQKASPSNSVLDYIYFSFITATTTGFGDIIPFGYFKLVAIFEVIFGLLLLAVVTSKLVSIKQDIILNEIYEISFNERINRLRSSLLVFRQNIGRVSEKIEDKSIHKREINDLYVYLSSLEDTLNDMLALLGGPGKSRFKKSLDPLNSEVLFNSVLQSFEKIIELINNANQNKLEWRREINVEMLNKCMLVNESLFARLKSSHNVADKIVNDFVNKKNSLTEQLKKELPGEPQSEQSKDIKK
ncbi:MAG: potassium channel family protein [Candidatus Woesearchaeota archaeon]